jgi:diguanylate cyclase (GGDEF)-like protein/PAS domain S-box-containing protein
MNKCEYRTGSDIFLYFNLKGEFKSLSQEFLEILGYKSHELMGRNIQEIIHPDDRDFSKDGLVDVLSGVILTNFEHRILAKNGRYHWVSWVAIPFLTEEFILGIFQDVTIQREIDIEIVNQGRKYRDVFENLPMGIAITNTNGIILEINDSARALFEIPIGTKLKRSLNHKKWKVVSSSGSSILPRNFTLLQALKKKESLKGLEFGMMRKEDDPNSILWLEVMASPLHIDGYGLAVGFKDITERKLAEERNIYLSNYDEITGLPRRKNLVTKMDVLLEEAHRHEKKIGIIALDIDNFKYLNDSFGHKFGDLFLKEVANRIQGSIRNFDILSREGGDEYMIALPDIENETDAAVVCESIQDALSRPIQIGKYSAFTSVSMGISIFPNDGKDPDSLLKNADNALHQAKKMGKNVYSYYTASMQDFVRSRLELEHSLRVALQREQFELYYQPKVELSENKVIGFEALIRWKHPEKGMISPYDFIPLAEETGLIVPIGEWVMESAIQQIAIWQKYIPDKFHIAINLSIKQFNHEFLVSNLGKFLENYKISPKSLEVEITESVLIDNTDRAIQILHEIHNLGVSITIDDFGTGYSSLGYLKKFPVRALKIDKSFIQDLEMDEDSQVIVKAVINLGHNLGLKVVAEGAETIMQCQILKTLEVDSIQGYYYAKPMRADEALNFIKTYNSV